MGNNEVVQQNVGTCVESASVPVTGAGEIEWYEGVGKQLHRLKVRLDIILWSVIGVAAFLAYFLFQNYEEQYAWTELGYLSIFLLTLTLILVGACVADFLPRCYRYYVCKECGHIHRAKLNELDAEGDRLYCEKCNQHTRHKCAPMKK